MRSEVPFPYDVIAENGQLALDGGIGGVCRCQSCEVVGSQQGLDGIGQIGVLVHARPYWRKMYGAQGAVDAHPTMPFSSFEVQQTCGLRQSVEVEKEVAAAFLGAKKAVAVTAFIREVGFRRWCPRLEAAEGEARLRASQLHSHELRCPVRGEDGNGLPEFLS